MTLLVGDVNNLVVANSSFGGVIQNGAATVGLQKEGAGQLVLSGANTFTGGVTVNNGGLVVTGSLASTGTVTLASVWKSDGAGRQRQRREGRARFECERHASVLALRPPVIPWAL